MSKLFACPVAVAPAFVVSMDCERPTWTVPTSGHVVLSAHDRKILAPGGCDSSPLRRCEEVKP